MRSANRNREDRHGRDPGNKRDHAPPLRLVGTQPAVDGHENRSSYGAIPGAEFPTFVYVSVLVAFGWIMLAAWLAFARDMDAVLSLSIAVVLTIVFFALPIIIRHAAVTCSETKPQTNRDFLAAPVETATGPLSGAD